MPTVRDIAEEIVGREGGYVNDPDDPGGATNWGVTIHTMRRLGLDLTGDGAITPEDVRRLTRAQAVDIFIEHYFKRPGIAALPEVLQASVFDMYVNAGGNAVKILQRLLRDMGHDISVDGALGPQTCGAAHSADRAAPGHLADAYAIGPQTAEAAQIAYANAPRHLADAYGIARRNYYFRLADKRAASRKYARTRAGGKGGWIKRAEEFMNPRYHMSAEQFQQRVAAWG